MAEHTDISAVCGESTSTPDTTVHAVHRAWPLLPVAVWPLSGSYAGVGDDYRVEVMLDIDTLRSYALLTVDFYALDGEVGTHIGAGLLRSSTIVNHRDHTVIRGVGRFTFAAAAPLMEVHIERRHVLERRAPMNMRFLTMSLAPGGAYTCQYRSHAHLAAGCEASPMGTVLPFERPVLGQAS